MTEDPWRDIPAPNASQSVNAKRVDAELPWDFFWARDVERRCLLLLAYTHDAAPHIHLPRVRGIEVTTTSAFDQDQEMVVFRLMDTAQRDLFQKLCRDIVASTTKATCEREAVAIALRRTWRWHHLLRGGGDARLSSEEQKGLIGELLVLERYLLSTFNVADALNSWHGPLHAPKDFEVGAICIEAKARRGPSKPYVAISSEYQLDTSGMDMLFLHVVELDRAMVGDDEAFTVSDVAERVRGSVLDKDSGQADVLETLLEATGFRWEDDYSDHRWREGLSRVFRVSDDFPRVCAARLPMGVGEVKYTVSLQACSEHEVSPDMLLASLTGGTHAD